MSNELATVEQAVVPFSPVAAFELKQREAKRLSVSPLIPEAFKDNVSGCMDIYDLAQQIGKPPIAVALGLYFVRGRPQWKAEFVVACINSSGKFTGNLDYEFSGEGDNRQCVAYATRRDNGKVVYGDPVSIAMAKDAGWWSKKDKYGNETSHWQIYPDKMLRHRAASFFGRAHCPEILNGMAVQGELEDIKPANARTVTKPTFEEEK